MLLLTAGQHCQWVGVQQRARLTQPASDHETSAEHHHQAQPRNLQQDVHHQQDEGPEGISQQKAV